MLTNKNFLYMLALPSLFIPISGMADYYNGFYLGAGVGANATASEIKNTSSFDITSLAPTDSDSRVSEYDNRGTVLGELEIGYGRLLKNNFYLGLSGFMDFADRDMNHYLNMERRGGATQHDNKSSSSSLSSITGGITFEPGYLISPNTLFMTFIGWEHADIDLKGYQFVNVTPVNSAEHNLSKTKTLDGIRAGVGFQEQITPALSFGVRYLYTDFLQDASVSKTSDLSGFLSGPFTYTVKTQNITSQTVLLNMRYYWNQTNTAPFKYTHDANDLNGFYLGARIGANIPNIGGSKSTIIASYVDQGAITNSPTITTPKPTQQNTPAVDLAVGAGKIFNDYIYVAAEGSVQWDDKDIDSNIIQDFRPTTVAGAGQAPDSITHKINASLNDFEPAIDLKLGFALPHNLLPYVRVGAAFNEVNYKVYNQLTYLNDNSVTETVSVAGKDNKNFNAFLRLGAGLDYQHSSNGTFNLNYIYTNYGDYKVNTSTSGTDTAGRPYSLTSTNRLSLRNNVVSIGYTHYFGV